MNTTSAGKTPSNITAPTRFLELGNQKYAYRRFGAGSRLPLLFLQHFTGTLDNWDPAVTDPLASGREVILFENAGVGRSIGEAPATVAGMTGHAVALAQAQMSAFREWEQHTGERFANLRSIRHPTLVVNGIHDQISRVIHAASWRFPRL